MLKERQLACRKPLSPLQPRNQPARTAPSADKPAGLQKRPASRFAAESRAVGASAQDKENAKLSLRLQELLDSPKPSATPVASMAELRQRFQAGTPRTTVLLNAPRTAPGRHCLSTCPVTVTPRTLRPYPDVHNVLDPCSTTRAQ